MNLKKKNKGKVHPSPPSSSSSPSHTTSTSNKDTISALKLLPAAILTLISVLSLQDREVLAYMITRSIKATANPSLLLEENRRRRSKRQAAVEHKPPLFACGCFDCYTSYWFRWDSSPNRELIHRAIEAFEEHLASGEQSKKSGRGKRKEKIGERGCSEREMLSELEILESVMVLDGRDLSSRAAEVMDSPGPAVKLLESSNFPVEDPVGRVEEDGDRMTGEKQNSEEREDEASPETTEVESSSEVEKATVARTVVGGGNHKGLARKVLPDVIGLFNSRLWSLWSPSV